MGTSHACLNVGAVARLLHFWLPCGSCTALMDEVLPAGAQLELTMSFDRSSHSSDVSGTVSRQMLLLLP